MFRFLNTRITLRSTASSCSRRHWSSSMSSRRSDGRSSMLRGRKVCISSTTFFLTGLAIAFGNIDISWTRELAQLGEAHAVIINVIIVLHLQWAAASTCGRFTRSYYSMPRDISSSISSRMRIAIDDLLWYKFNLRCNYYIANKALISRKHAHLNPVNNIVSEQSNKREGSEIRDESYCAEGHRQKSLVQSEKGDLPECNPFERAKTQRDSECLREKNAMWTEEHSLALSFPLKHMYFFFPSVLAECNSPLAEGPRCREQPRIDVFWSICLSFCPLF